MEPAASDRRRLLGFAFANADFLVEIDAAGTILYVTGAVARFAATPDLIGRPLRELLEPDDGAHFAAQIQLLPACTRTSLTLNFAECGEASLSLFRLPDNDDRISCAISKADVRAAVPADEIDRKTGLPTRSSFDSAAAAKAAECDALTLVNLSALPRLCAELPADKSDALLAAIGQCISSSGAKAAGRLSETAFAVVAEAVAGPKSQIPALRAVMNRLGIGPMQIEESHIAMRAKGLRPEQRLLAMRHVLDYYATGRRQIRVSADMGEAFDAMMEETQERMRRLVDNIASAEFAIVYQPVLDLRAGDSYFFEALPRFSAGPSNDAVAFMETLGITNSFDFAVLLKLIAMLETDKTHGARVGVKISGRTVQSAAGFGMLASFLAQHRKLAPRLLFEIGETEQIADLDAAARAVEGLRTMGMRVGLTDFNPGPQALKFLHALPLDFVKFHSRVVKNLGSSGQSDKMVTTLVKLCGELGVPTIADGLETAKEVGLARQVGVRFGQGNALGAPGVIPPGTGHANHIGKRQGVQEAWG